MNTTHAVAGIDPHKHTATVAIVDVLGVLVTSLSVQVTKSGIDALTALLKATEMTIDRIGVEGSGGLGRPVMLALAAAGYDVREVQANRTAQRPQATLSHQDRHRGCRGNRSGDPGRGGSAAGRQGQRPATSGRPARRRARLASIACSATGSAVERSRGSSRVAAAAAA
ncbi:MAG: IS110 family transposase [Geodermatophilaceae bacterium]